MRWQVFENLAQPNSRKSSSRLFLHGSRSAVWQEQVSGGKRLHNFLCFAGRDNLQGAARRGRRREGQGPRVPFSRDLPDRLPPVPASTAAAAAHAASRQAGTRHSARAPAPAGLGEKGLRPGAPSGNRWRVARQGRTMVGTREADGEGGREPASTRVVAGDSEGPARSFPPSESGLAQDQELTAAAAQA